MTHATPERLRAVITALRATDTEVIAIAGISRSTLYRWLRGEAPIHTGILKLLELMVITDAQTTPALRAFMWAEPPDEEKSDACTPQD
jgi:predicted transcriptional regulator